MFWGRMIRGPSAVMTEDDQGIEKLECRGCDYEHVDRHNIGQVVVQKATPGRGGGFGSPWHVPSDGGLARVNSKLEQFAVDSGRPPEWIGQAHPADQITDLSAHLGPCPTA